MPLITGNVGTWANHFLPPEHLRPAGARRAPLHRGLFARAQSALHGQHNPHTLYWLAQQPPVVVMVPGWLLLCPLGPLETVVAEVLCGLSRPAESLFRLGRFVLRHAWGLAFLGASLAVDVVAGICVALVDAVQVLCLVNAAFALSSAALALLAVGAFYGVSSLAGAARHAPPGMFEDGTSRLRAVLFSSFPLILGPRLTWGASL